VLCLVAPMLFVGPFFAQRILGDGQREAQSFDFRP
jgi:hypothetical protein